MCKAYGVQATLPKDMGYGSGVKNTAVCVKAGVLVQGSMQEGVTHPNTSSGSLNGMPTAAANCLHEQLTLMLVCFVARCWYLVDDLFRTHCPDHDHCVQTAGMQLVTVSSSTDCITSTDTYVHIKMRESRV